MLHPVNQNSPDRLNISLKDFLLLQNSEARGVSAGYAIMASLTGLPFSQDNDVTVACSGKKFHVVKLPRNTISIQPPTEIKYETKKANLFAISEQIITDELNSVVAATENKTLRDCFAVPLDELTQNVFDHSGSDCAITCALRTNYNATIAIGDRGNGVSPPILKRIEIFEFRDAFIDGTDASNSSLFRRCEAYGIEVLPLYLCPVPRVSAGSSGNRGFGLFQLREVSDNWCMYSNGVLAYSSNGRTEIINVPPSHISEKLENVGLVSEYYIDLHKLPTRLARARQQLAKLTATGGLEKVIEILERHRLKKHVIDKLIEA